MNISIRWTRDGKPLPVTDFNFKDMESIMVCNFENKWILVNSVLLYSRI